MKQPKQKYPNGSRVIYKDHIFKVDNAYYKPPELSPSGWFYNLDHFDFQRIAEKDLRPYSLQNKVADILHKQLNDR